MNIFKIATLLLLTISFASCKRDYADSMAKAPTNISASSSFVIENQLGTNFPSVDFTLGLPFSFTAKFNETVTWKIELYGQTSKAQKTISATSAIIDGTNSEWIGNHDGLYFFESGESVTANLIISGIAGVSSTHTFTVSQERDTYTSTPTFMLVNPNSNFEVDGTYPTQFSVFPVGGKYDIAYKTQSDTVSAPEGLRFMRLEGVSTEANGFFVGGLQCRKNATAAFNPADSTNFLPKSWTDPNQIYLNVYVRGIDNLPKGNFPYAILNFECHEDDNRNPSDTANCDYYFKQPSGTNTDYFCPSSEDSWVFKIPVKHIGWQLFSCKYSDLVPSEDFKNGGFGNRKLEPQKIARVQFGLISSPPFNLVSADIDFACFTYGAPYDPKK